jgi:hypothetical protein
MDEQNAAMTLGLLSSGGVSPNPQAQNPHQQPRNKGFESVFSNTTIGQDQGYGGVFGVQGATNTPDALNVMFENGTSDFAGMNLDWVSPNPPATSTC